MHRFVDHAVRPIAMSRLPNLTDGPQLVASATMRAHVPVVLQL
jgi:hypothetical protein